MPAASPAAASSSPTRAIRQSQGNVAVDVATQLVQVEEGAGDHRRHHLLRIDSDPDLGHRRRPKIVQVSPASSSPTLTAARPRRQDQRRVLPHHHLGRAAGRGRGEICAGPGPEEARRSSTSTTTSASTWSTSSRRPTRRWAARSSRSRPTTRSRPSYQAEVTAAMAGAPDALYLVSYPGRRRDHRPAVDLPGRAGEVPAQ